jgi:Family of unknown function (DUF6516)
VAFFYSLAYLTTAPNVVKIDNMPAQLITQFKNVGPDGDMIEAVVWRVPEPVPPSQHAFKYRLVWIVDGQRLVGFDNERGKGDHCHLDGLQVPYIFSTVEQLFEDFGNAIAKRRKP